MHNPAYLPSVWVMTVNQNDGLRFTGALWIRYSDGYTGRVYTKEIASIDEIGDEFWSMVNSFQGEVYVGYERVK